MDEQTTDTTPTSPGPRERVGQRAWVRSAVWVGRGDRAGQDAADDEPSSGATGSSGYGAPADGDRDGDGRGPGGHHGGPGAGEEPLTGDTADSVEAAVLEEYPGATIERLETDADGVYEAHITTADGEQVTVEFDDSFAVTGTEQH